MPSFQSPVPISGRPCAPTVRLRSSARAQCSKSVPPSASDRRLEIGLVLLRRERPARRERGRPRRAPPRRRWPPRSAPRRTAARARRRRCASAPRAPMADATSAGRRPPRTAGPRRAGGARRASRARRHRQRHRVLQLVAESVGAPRPDRRPCAPRAAGQRLVQQPAIDEEVHRAVRRLDLDRAERCRPSGVVTALRARSRSRSRVRGSPAPAPRRPSPPRRAGTRPRRVRPAAARSVSAAPRTDRGPRRPGPTAGRPARGRAGWSGVPCRPSTSVRSQVHALWWPPRSANATRSPKSTFHGLRASSAPVRRRPR